MTATATKTTLDAVFAAIDAPLTADDFRSRVAAHIHNGVDQAGDAYEFSPHSDGFTYGVNRWRFVLAEIGLGFADIEGITTMNSGGMRVTILPVGGDRNVLIYPLCFADDAYTSAQYVKVRPSRLRKLLFAGTASRHGLQLMLPGTDPQVEVVPIDEDDPEAAGEDAIAAEVEAAIAALPVLPKSIIVGYASNHNAGLLQLVVGEATMASDGTLDFLWQEQLDRTGSGANMHAVRDTDGMRFDADPEPEYDVIPQEWDEPGTGADD